MAYAHCSHFQVYHIGVGGGSGAACSRPVLGASTFSSTKVGALSVVAHPDTGQYLFFLFFGIALLLVSQPVPSSSVLSHSLTHSPSLRSWVLAARSKPVNTVLPFWPKRMAKSQNGQARRSRCRLKYTHQLFQPSGASGNSDQIFPSQTSHLSLSTR